MLPVGRDLLAPTKWDDFLTHLSFANNPMSHYWTPTLIFVFLATIVYREGHTSPKLTLSFLQVTIFAYQFFLKRSKQLSYIFRLSNLIPMYGILISYMNNADLTSFY